MRLVLGLLLAGVLVAAPTISSVTDNSPVGRHAKFEVAASITTTATSNFFPYDASPPNGVDPTNYPVYAGISVDLLISPDNWTTTYTSPCFWYQGHDEAVKGGYDWFYPNAISGWRCRVAPTSTGAWKYKVRATDSTGTTTTTETVFTVTTSTSKGFLKVSATDNRYFEFSDGSVFWSPSIELAANVDDPKSVGAAILTTLGTYGIKLLRVWNMMYGSAWTDWPMNNGQYDGYVPRAGLEPKADGTNTYLAAVVDAADGTGWYGSCRAFAWTRTPAVKRNTDYHFSITYMASGITGPREGGSFGVVGGYDSSTNFYCQNAGQGTVVTTYGGNETALTTISGTWNSGTNDYALYFWVAVRNATAGKAWITDIALREDLGEGSFGVNLFNDGSQQYETYVPERAAYGLDKWLEAVEAAGVYIKMTLLEKNDAMWLKLDSDGTWVIGGESDNTDGVFDSGRTLNKSQWLQQALWRYAQARWGYSTAIHSWELLNEGDPGDHRLHRRADVQLRAPERAYDHDLVLEWSPGELLGQRQLPKSVLRRCALLHLHWPWGYNGEGHQRGRLCLPAHLRRRILLPYCYDAMLSW
jgi:hypothetical protein